MVFKVSQYCIIIISEGKNSTKKLEATKHLQPASFATPIGCQRLPPGLRASTFKH